MKERKNVASFLCEDLLLEILKKPKRNKDHLTKCRIINLKANPSKTPSPRKANTSPSPPPLYCSFAPLFSPYALAFSVDFSMEGEQLVINE